GARRAGLVPMDMPRSLPFLDGMLSLFAAGGFRMLVRMEQHTLREHHAADAKRVLVIGASLAGQMLVRELQTKPILGLRPIGFVDGDSNKHDLRIANLPVFGGYDMLTEVIKDQHVDQVIIALPNASGKEIRELLQACDKAGVPARTVPSLSSIIDDTVSVSQLRNVDIEDLLRREPIQTDVESVRKLINGKRVLITGAGGSIGSELCRQVLNFGPADLGLLGHGENSIFEIDNELRRIVERKESSSTVRKTQIHPFIADVRLPNRIRTVISEFRPDVIFHAAAHKHVPLMELNPTEAISNNVFGTKNMLDAALEFKVENFVMISTDKVVNPTNVMGASKRAAEMLVLKAASQSGRNYVAVRFGNVLGSRGSVVPTFKKQIASGGPVRVSHPDMKRFFMTIPEAVQLVLQSSVLGSGGEVFMLDMGEPIKIVDLAKDLIELSGLELGADIDIVYSGIRPGEKLVEELFIKGETYQPTKHEKVRIVQNACSFVAEKLDETIRDLDLVVRADDQHGVIRCLTNIIPEFVPDSRRWVQESSASAPSESKETVSARG
ncbi:MAG: nucleoside-diphosphate sugar epimerase/dehydratase, partial [Chthonomonadales bacterium]